MLSKNKARFIISLQKKKAREEEGLYIIEGDKIVREFLAAKVKVRSLVAKPEFINSLTPEMSEIPEEIEEAGFDDLKQISTLKTPHNALAIVHIPEKNLNLSEVLDDLCVALEFVQDPGNLGTIIRAAGWFGIKNIVCSPDCVDVYNPRVVQASMGALLHVNVFYHDLPEILSFASATGAPVFGTMLEGESIYGHALAHSGIILLGNESRGISGNLVPFINEKIMIPGFSAAKPGLDSLNVGMAASIVFSEFRRRNSVP
jgi:TrmH family RNA methyltransferase